jgi:hypothetical protein
MPYTVTVYDTVDTPTPEAAGDLVRDLLEGIVEDYTVCDYEDIYDPTL